MLQWLRARRPAFVAGTFIAATVAMLATAPGAWAHPGDLDSSFGSHGVTVLPNSLMPSGLLAQANGDLVVAGESGATSDGLLARFTPSGSLDSSFGSGGTVDNATTVGESWTGAAVQPNGKIIAVNAGSLTRYNPDGSVDTTFGTGGSVFTSPVGANAVALAGNGDILVAGTGPASDFAVERFTPGGIADGYFEHQFDTGPEPESTATSLAIQPNGEVVAAGYAGGPLQERIVLARFTAGGLDQSFGSGGAVIQQLGTGASPYSQADSVALEPDGSIVVAGSGTDGSDNVLGLILARYSASGQPDPGFGPDGHVLSPLGGGLFGSPVALGVQSNGDLVIGTSAEIPGFGLAVRQTWSAVTARYLPTGALDPGYGRCGLTGTQLDTTPQGPGTSRPLSLLLHGDQIDLAGDLYPPSTSNQYNLFIARYIGGGAPASVPAGWTSTFGIPLPPPPPPGSAYSAAIDPGIKVGAALVATAMSWNDFLEMAVKIGLLVVPVVGEEVALFDAADIVSTLIEGGATQVAEDPPSKHYRSLVRLPAFPMPRIHPGKGVTTAAARAFNAYAANGAEIAALERAYVSSAERAERATLAHDSSWQRRQSDAARSFERRLAIALRRRVGLARTLGRRLHGTPLGRLNLGLGQIAKARRALARRGLPAPVVHRLRKLGVSNAGLRATIHFALSHPAPHHLSLDSFLASKAVATVFDGTAKDLGAEAGCNGAG